MFGDLGRVMATSQTAWRVHGQQSGRVTPLISQDTNSRVRSDIALGSGDLSHGSRQGEQSRETSSRSCYDAGLPQVIPSEAPNVPVESKFVIRSCNITAWRPHAPELLSWNADVVLMQESRLTAVAQQQATTTARSAGRHLLHGAPVPVQSSQELQEGGQRYIKPTIWNGRHGGVSIMSRLPTQSTLAHDTSYDADRNLWERQRFALARVPLATNRSIMVASFYGLAGGGSPHRRDQHFECNERMLQQVFEVASRYGDVPFIIGMDANIQVDKSPTLVTALSTSRWHDAGEVFGHAGGLAPTYCQDPQWDKHAAIPGATRIDYILVNSTALSALRDFRLVRDAGLPGHLVLEAEFNFTAFREEGYTLRQPRPFPLKKMPQYDDATLEEMGQRTWQPLEAPYRDALQLGRADRAWQLLNHGLECFLEALAEELPCTWSLGRGQPPRFDQFSSRAPRENINGGAQTMHLRQLQKLLQQGRSYLAQSRRHVRWHTEGRPISGADYRQRVEAWRSFCRKGRGLLEADWDRWWTDAEPAIQDMQAIVDALARRFDWEAKRQAQGRVQKWRESLRKSFRNDRSVLCKWVRQREQRPITHVIAEDGVKSAVPDMLLSLEDFWVKLFNLYSHDTPPTWEAFQQRYGHTFPACQPCKLPKITARDWKAQVHKLPLHAGKGVDGWRAGELQRLPLFLWEIVADFFDAIEQGMQWPKSLTYAQIGLMPKGDVSKPGKQRPISVFGILYRCWSSLRFRHMQSWREQWMPDNMRGARAGGSTHDISIMLSLDVEVAQLEGRPIGGFLFDREKCFDRLTFDITDGLAGVFQAPEGVRIAMNRLCRQTKRFLKIGKFCGRVFQATNALPQGCSWSILSILMHMAVWHRDLASCAPLAVTYSFYDDSSTTGPDQETLDTALAATIEFDEYTGGLLNGEKSIAFAIGEELKAHLQQQNLYGQPLTVADYGKLLGAFLSFGGDFPEDKQDERLQRLITVMRRIRSVPGTPQVRGYLVDIFASAAIAFGTEQGGYSDKAKKEYMALLRQTLWNCDNMWPNMAITLAILFKGHRFDVEAIEHHEPLRLWRRQIVRDEHTRSKLQHAWALKQQCPEVVTGGILHRLDVVARDLGWTWSQYDVFQRPGDVPLQCGLAKNIFEHQLRESYRRDKIANGTHRKDNVGQHAGVDYDITVALLRTWERNPNVTTPLRIGILRRCLGGALYTRQRLHRAKVVETPWCTFCDRHEEEDGWHLFWTCPRWESLRQYVKSITTEQQRWFMHGCLAHCGVAPVHTEAEDWFVQSYTPETTDGAAHATEPGDAECEVIRDGFLLTASDGACRHAQFPKLRSAGCGMYYGKDHSCNRSFPLMGVVRDAARAEIAAALHIIRTAWRPTEILIDRKATLDGLRRIEQGISYKDLANADLLEHAANAWQAKGGSVFFKFTKVAAHGRGGSGQDQLHTAYNAAADRLATAAADSVKPPDDLADQYKQYAKLVRAIQIMCVDILEAQKAATAEDIQVNDPPEPPPESAAPGAERDQAMAVEALPAAQFSNIYPDYVWPREGDEDGHSHAVPQPVTWRQVTPQFRQFWLYGLEAFHAVQWYFRHLKWYTTPDADNPLTVADVTWAELVLDFSLSTGCRMWKMDQNPTNLVQQAEAFKKAAQSMANVIARVTCSFPNSLFPGSVIRKAVILRSMGFAAALGLSVRPQLMQPLTVGRVLAGWIAKQNLPLDRANRPIGSYSWVPALTEGHLLWHPDERYKAPVPSRTQNGQLSLWHPCMDGTCGPGKNGVHRQQLQCRVWHPPAPVPEAEQKRVRLNKKHPPPCVANAVGSVQPPVRQLVVPPAESLGEAASSAQPRAGAEESSDKKVRKDAAKPAQPAPTVCEVVASIRRSSWKLGQSYPEAVVQQMKLMTNHERIRVHKTMGVTETCDRRAATNATGQMKATLLRKLYDQCALLNKRAGKPFHHLVPTDDGTKVQCSRCGRCTPRGALSLWRNELCHSAAAASSSAK